MDEGSFRWEDEREKAPPPDRERVDPSRIELRPLAEDHVGELRWIHSRPMVVKWWDEPEPDFPWDEPDSTRLTILVDGRIAGMIQYWEEEEPKYRHAGIDLFVEPDLANRGIGTEAVRRVARYLFEDRGHHRLEIDPAAGNQAAIRAYEKVGFKPVGILRRSERDADGKGWHDGLMMDMLATEFNRGDQH